MSEGFKQTQTERCVVYCVSDIRVIHMAPSAGSLCFPPTADFHPCSPRGAGVGVGWGKRVSQGDHNNQEDHGP